MIKMINYSQKLQIKNSVQKTLNFFINDSFLEKFETKKNPQNFHFEDFVISSFAGKFL